MPSVAKREKRLNMGLASKAIPPIPYEGMPMEHAGDNRRNAKLKADEGKLLISRMTDESLKLRQILRSRDARRDPCGVLSVADAPGVQAAIWRHIQ
jgi:hypothetical protein